MKNANLTRPDLDQLGSEVFDLIVVGGGITGAGIAQDAAARGLKTLVLEKGDFASGTSSKSTKLVHGGLRYLQNLQFAVTLESVRERELMQKIAPHMVWSLPFVIPTYRSSRLKTLKLNAGLWVYDLMAGKRGTGFHKRISRAEVLKRCPGIKADGLTGGLVYSDCRTDDARHTLEVLKSAVECGATIVNYAQVVGLLHGADGRVSGVSVRDLESADATPVNLSARVVVNATGVWTQKTSELTGRKGRTEVVPAKGIHIVVSRRRLPLDCAMIVDSVHDKRFCFAVPWYDSIVIGTTDTPYSGDIEKLTVEKDEVAYVLDAVNALFPDAKVTDADVTGSYAGLRPLVREVGASGNTADLSRGHTLEESEDGLISIAGGKLTTYRPMAKETVDMVVENLLLEQPKRRIGACSTDKLVLGGWEDAKVRKLTRAFEELGWDALGLEVDTASYLPTVYGARTGAVLSLIQADPRLADKISPDHPYIFAQVVYAARHEMARTVDDVLSRRIRLSITDRAAAVKAAERVSSIVAAELNLTESQRVAQVERFVADFGR
jgi:glycerol-3-phosphate dehydrogenase